MAGHHYRQSEGRRPMSDDYTILPQPGAASRIADEIKVASDAVTDAFETARRPGMLPDALTKAVRAAPLAALGIAFLLGMSYARRR
jgi:hypothetical protein